MPPATLLTSFRNFRLLRQFSSVQFSSVQFSSSFENQWLATPIGGELFRSSLTHNKILPILSSSVVARPLTDAELAACNFQSRIFMTDTRTLRFYYRLLPDKRLQLGSQSSITGANSQDPAHRKRLTDAIARKLPPLKGIPIDYSCWGWVDVSHDIMKRAGGGFDYSYNAQTAVDETAHIIVSAEVVNTSSDVHQLVPVLDESPRVLRRSVGLSQADTAAWLANCR
jgi:hypothetical protein